MAFNFGVNGVQSGEPAASPQEEKTDLNNNPTGVPEGDGQEPPKDNPSEPPTDKVDEPENVEFAIEPGTQLEFDGKEYSVDEKGNIVDADGNIFKEAKDVKEWKDSLDVDETPDNNIIDLKTIQDQVGIDITDKDGNVIEFQNTAEGIASYVHQVIENSREANMSEALDGLFTKYPILSDVLDYYLANGESLEGFTNTPDRSSITIDENNIEQQEQIIKTAWKEQGRKGDVKGYIDYLKSSGTLFSVANEELEALKEADAEAKADRQKKAQEYEQEQIRQATEYWNKVNNVIKSKKLGSYTLPDNIIRNVNGTKTVGSLEDFFNYIYKVDKDNHSAYYNDLAKETPEDRLNDELLRAYLKYTGGNYESLVNMKVAEQEVKRLKLQSKNSAKKPLRMTPPKKSETDKLDFGV